MRYEHDWVTLFGVYVVVPSMILLGLARMLKGLIYDMAITRMTSKWYRTVLERLPARSALLDVGIGTGTALGTNAELVLEKELRVVGIDYDREYIKRCRSVLTWTGLTENVQVFLDSVYAYEYDPKHTGGKDAFDNVYFSGSLMIMPDPTEALEYTASLMHDDGRIFITQTFQQRRSRALEAIKPLLKYLLTIDFGAVTYEEDFEANIPDSLEVEERCDIVPDVPWWQACLPRSRSRVAKLVVLRKRKKKTQ